MTTPGPFTARPLGDGVWIVVGRDDDEGDTHTVCRAFFGTELSGTDGKSP